MKYFFVIVSLTALFFPLFSSSEEGPNTNNDYNYSLSDFNFDAEKHEVSQLFIYVQEDRPGMDRVAFRDDDPVRVPITETWFAQGYIFLKFEGACFTPNFWAGGIEAPQEACLDTYAVRIPDFYWSRWIERRVSKQTYLDRISMNQAEHESQSFSNFLNYLNQLNSPTVIKANSSGICIVGYYTDDEKIKEIKERYRNSQVEKGQLRHWCSIMYPTLDVPLFYYSKLTGWDKRDGLLLDYSLKSEVSKEEVSLFNGVFPPVDSEKAGGRGQY